MSASILLDNLEKQGIELSLQNGSVSFRAPKGKMTLELIEQIKQYKEEIIDILQKEKTFPLSYGQQALWYLSKSNPSSAAYNTATGSRIQGIPKKYAFEVFKELVNRHPALRTIIKTTDGHLLQEIQESIEYPFAETCIANCDIETVNQAVYEEIHAPFKLENSPLCRFHVFYYSDSEFIVAFTIHHIITDNWSIAILNEEFGTIFMEKYLNRPTSLAKDDKLYKKYVKWQQTWLQSAMAEQEWCYWKKKLDGANATLNLPLDRLRPMTPSYEGDIYEYKITPELTQKIYEFTRERKITTFQLMLSLFEVLIYRYTQQEDFLVGIPVSNRENEEFENVLGYLINTVAVRSDIKKDERVVDLFRKVQQTSNEAIGHQNYPYSLLVKKCRENNISAPLFQVMVTIYKHTAFKNAKSICSVEENEAGKMHFGNTSMQGLHFKQQEGQVDLSVDFVETGQEIFCLYKYDVSLFEEDTVRRMNNCFLEILKAVLENPEIKISEIDILDETEKQIILAEYNKSERNYPRNKCIQEIFEERVLQQPESPALIFKGQTLSYWEVNEKANCLAHLLRSKGIGTNVLTAIVLDCSFEMIISIIAIIKAGGAYLPVDPKIPYERLRFIIKDANVKVLICNKNFAEEFQPECDFIDVTNNTIWQGKTENPEKINTSVDLCYVIYTSGSTGIPKGVKIRHFSVVNLLDHLQELYPVKENDSFLFKTNFTFDVSVTEIFGWFFGYGKLVIMENGFDQDPQKIIHNIDKHNITHINFVPSIFKTVLNVLSESQLMVLEKLKYILLCGEVVQKEMVIDFYRKVKGVTLENIYGPTEATVYATAYSLKKFKSEINVPIGKPLANYQMYIVNPEFKLQPIGVPGELLIAGDGLAEGYLNRDELTNEKFIKNLFKPDKLYYRTGDLARWLPNGEIEFLGRMDTQVKIRGFRIELGEIESQLLKTEVVKQVAVTSKTDKSGINYLCAFIVSDQKIDISVIKKQLLHVLPEYMVPTFIFQIEKLLYNTSGKVDRKALNALNIESFDAERQLIAPANSTEKELLQIWKEHLDREQISTDDNFFEIGGNSLLVAVILGRINERFKVELPLQDFLLRPEIKVLAEKIEKSKNRKQTKETEYVALNSEAILDNTIHANGKLFQDNSTAPMNIFLTGATGFVGTYLLAELLNETTSQIYCLIRAKSADEGKSTIIGKLKEGKVWNDLFYDRILPVLGDLSEDLLGMDDKVFHLLASVVDVIYHNGAFVNHILPYPQLKAANVHGTSEILKLATISRIKPVHYISTTSIFTFSGKKRTVDELSDIAEEVHPVSHGYNSSKWVADNLMTIAMKRNVPASIYRLARVIGHSKTGIGNNKDFFHRFIASCLETGFYPDSMPDDNLLPIDYAVKAIVKLSQSDTSIQKVYHVLHPRNTSIVQFLKQLNKENKVLKKITFSMWFEKMQQEFQHDSHFPIGPYLPLFRQYVINAKQGLVLPKIKGEITYERIQKLGIEFRDIDQELIQTYYTTFSSLTEL
ncbi:MAG: amino acid adenylation domain-containing protein [Bacteroidales bacterium]|nr:amino acid adenylation domain-containing protein [Bacteroidales bacterium]